MWILISVVIIVTCISVWTLIKVASDADDNIDTYDETLKKLNSPEYKEQRGKENEIRN